MILHHGSPAIISHPDVRLDLASNQIIDESLRFWESEQL